MVAVVVSAGSGAMLEGALALLPLPATGTAGDTDDGTTAAVPVTLVTGIKITAALGGMAKPCSFAPVGIEPCPSCWAVVKLLVGETSVAAAGEVTAAPWYCT